ncbi:unnamed protein product [Cochlearia groenlandica]
MTEQANKAAKKVLSAVELDSVEDRQELQVEVAAGKPIEVENDQSTKGHLTSSATRNIDPAAKQMAVPARKATSTLLAAMIGNNKALLNGTDSNRVEAHVTKPNGLSKSIGLFKKPNALALAVKYWYEETEAEEKEMEKEQARKAKGPSSAPSGPGRFVATRKGTDLEPLAIEEIISPLINLIDIPITVEDTISSEKKKKGFTETLHARKKIVNTLARNKKMIKTSRLTMSDFNYVAKLRPSKAGPDKEIFFENFKGTGGKGTTVEGI